MMLTWMLYKHTAVKMLAIRIHRSDQILVYFVETIQILLTDWIMGVGKGGWGQGDLGSKWWRVSFFSSRI